jgi:hypothetical protein
MKTRKYIYTTLATCLFVFSSCLNDLDVLPLDPTVEQQTKLIPMRKATLKDFIKYTQFGRYPDKTAAAVQIFQALMQEILHYYAVGGLYKNSQPMK